MALDKILKKYMADHDISMRELARRAELSPQTISNIVNNKKQTDLATFQKLAKGMGMSPTDLFTMDMEDYEPTVTGEYVSFPILGEVAAGYERYADADQFGTIDIPSGWLRGRPMTDYFVLKVSGDSMYPTYQDGDLVLVLKQSTMNYSGQVGVVMYDDDKATLKRIEYVMGEDWMRLVPINPQYPPIMVTDERLEHCRVLGLPKKLIRDINL